MAGIPDDVAYRPKWKIALELLDRAKGNGVTFDWLTFDEGYGGKPEFLRELQGDKRCFVGEVPRMFTGWIHEPCVTERPFRRAKGRGRKTPRMLGGIPSIGLSSGKKNPVRLRPVADGDGPSVALLQLRNHQRFLWQ